MKDLKKLSSCLVCHEIQFFLTKSRLLQNAIQLINFRKLPQKTL